MLNCSRFILGAFLVFYGASFAQDLSAVDTISLESLLETEISTAAKYAQTPFEAPASVTIITADEIKSQGFKTLTDLLATVRSFYLTNERNYGHVGVRGFSRLLDFNLHTLILINGHTVNENIFGSAPAGTELMIDLDSVEKIEIVRGPGSALYGTGALFAVINIFTKDGAAIDGMEVAGNTGSFGSFGGNLLYGKEKNGYNLMTSVSINSIEGQNLYFPEYNDSVNSDGWARNLDSDRGYGFLSTLSKNDLKFQIYLSWRRKEIPTGAWGMSFNEGPAQSVDSWNHIEANYDHNISSKSHLYLRGYYDHYLFRGWYPYDELNEDNAFGDLIGSEIQTRYDISSNNRLTFGGEIQDHLQARYKVWAGDFIFFNKNVTSTLASLYIQDEYQLFPNLALLAGVRHDRYSNDISSSNPRFAVVYNPVKNGALKLLYGKAFRKPNLYEVYYSDEYAYDKPNLDLKPEIIETYECDWEYRITRNFYGYVSGFHNKLTDLIEQVLDPADSMLQYQNLEKASANGFEAELKLHNPQNGLYAYGSYTYQVAKNTSLDIKLPNNPEHIIKFGGAYPVLSFLSWGADFLYESERITAYDTKTNDYLLTNMNFSLRHHIFEHEKEDNWDRIDLSLLVKNVFDVKYSNPVSLEYRQLSIPQDGRYIGLRLRVKL